MIQVQCPAQGSVNPSQVEALFVELDDEQLGLVAGGSILPTGGWAPAESWLPTGGW
jgi:hypothetical protein